MYMVEKIGIYCLSRVTECCYCFLTNEAATFVEFREFIILLFRGHLYRWG